MERIAGLILAGGRARRMGGADKAFCHLGGESLVARAVRRLAPQVAVLAIAGGRAPGRFGDFGLPVLVDAAADTGPLAGVLAGLDWAASLSPRPAHLVTVPVDVPFFPDDLAARLVATAGADGLAVAAGRGGLQPVFSAWPLALADPLRTFLAEGGGRIGAFLDAYAARSVVFAPAGPIDPFLNVNTPDDLVAARRLLAPGAPTDK